MNHNKTNRAVFLDRDGVINHDPGDYTTCLEEFTILPGVIESLIDFTKRGYGIIVITNQGGIAKGKYSLHDFYRIDTYMRQQFIDAGINYIETYFCPHHDAISKCLCRKPGSAMIEKALSRHAIHASLSFMVGDKERDLVAAAGAGVRGVKIEVNQDLRTVKFPFEG